MRHHSTWTLSVLTVALLVFSLPIVASAQEAKGIEIVPKPGVAAKVQFASGDSALKIPLEIDNKIIRMQVQVNGSKPLRFIFDTGAGFTAIDSRRAKELGLKSFGNASANATGGRVSTSWINGVSLRVPGAEVSNQTIASMLLPGPPGFEFDGIIGYDFIKEFVVEIDYLTSIMNLHRPASYKYSGPGQVIPLLLAQRRTPLVIMKFIFEGRGQLETKLEVDTGADGTVVLNSPLVKKENLLAVTSEQVQQAARGAGGESKRVLGQVKAAQLGQFVFASPPVALSLDTQGAHASEDNDGVVGGEIFRRFKLIIDYSRNRMILEPNKSFNDAYDVEGGAE